MPQRSECRGTVIDVDIDGASARAISDEDPLEARLWIRRFQFHPRCQQSPLPTWHDGNQSPRFPRDASLVTSDSEHALPVRASSTADAGEDGCLCQIFRPSKEIADLTNHRSSISGEIEGHGVRYDKR